MKKYGYVEIKFPRAFNKKLKNILRNLVDSDKFYYSDAVDYIQGDVTDKIHLTVFFGLRDVELKNKKLKTFLKNLKVENILFDKFLIIDGYKGLYKVLSLSIDNESKSKLQEIHDEIMKYNFDPEMIHDEFKPHVTLAYVIKDFEIPKNAESININVKPNSFKLSEFIDDRA
jgi:2'-5' RNA ligase